MMRMENLLECRNLTKQYGKEAPALDNVSLSIKTNGIFALLGRNGAGKTTLIRILATELNAKLRKREHQRDGCGE